MASGIRCDLDSNRTSRRYPPTVAEVCLASDCAARATVCPPERASDHSAGTVLAGGENPAFGGAYLAHARAARRSAASMAPAVG